MKEVLKDVNRIVEYGFIAIGYCEMPCKQVYEQEGPVKIFK